MQTFLLFLLEPVSSIKNKDPGETYRIHNMAVLFYSYGDSSSDLSFVNFLAVLNTILFWKFFGQS
jgi:hypothetical protein